MSKFDSMGKEELRKACKAAGIAYGKLNNDGMRAALESNFKSAATAAILAQAKPGETIVINGEVKSQPVTPVAQANTSAPRAKVVGEVVSVKSLKIEKNRESRNGVTRPSVGSICRAIWDALDAKRKATKKVPTFEDVRGLMQANNWQRNTAFTQFQRWKEFHGVMPTQVDMEDDE